MNNQYFLKDYDRLQAEYMRQSLMQTPLDPVERKKAMDAYYAAKSAFEEAQRNLTKL